MSSIDEARSEKRNEKRIEEEGTNKREIVALGKEVRGLKKNINEKERERERVRVRE